MSCGLRSSAGSIANGLPLGGQLLERRSRQRMHAQVHDQPTRLVHHEADLDGIGVGQIVGQILDDVERMIGPSPAERRRATRPRRPCSSPATPAPAPRARTAPPRSPPSAPCARRCRWRARSAPDRPRRSTSSPVPAWRASSASIAPRPRASTESLSTMVAPFCQTQPRPPEPLSIWTTSPRRATTVPSAADDHAAPGSTPLAGIAMTSPPTSLAAASRPRPRRWGSSVSRFSPTLGGRPGLGQQRLLDAGGVEGQRHRVRHQRHRAGQRAIDGRDRDRRQQQRPRLGRRPERAAIAPARQSPAAAAGRLAGGAAAAGGAVRGRRRRRRRSATGHRQVERDRRENHPGRRRAPTERAGTKDLLGPCERMAAGYATSGRALGISGPRSSPR